MKINKLFITIFCLMQAACQTSATPTLFPTQTKTNPISTFVPTITSQPTDDIAATITPALNSDLDYWNGLQYDTRKWTIITYNDTEWTPQTYPTYTLEPVLIHSFIEGCMIYLEKGRGLSAGITYSEIPVIIGGHVIFYERLFVDENGQEMFMVINPSYHVDFLHNENKAQCIKDAERVIMTGMGRGCPSGDCGYCPSLPYTNLKTGNLVMLVNPEKALPVTEPGGNINVGSEANWYFNDGSFSLKVIDGPVCVDDNAWWQLESPNNIIGWDSDDHFIVQP